MTFLTVPIAAKNSAQAAEQINSALAGGAEMLELRTDYLESLQVQMVTELVSQIKTAPTGSLPIIVTCRDSQQGGAIDYPLNLRLDVLAAAVKAGADFIDFEYENFLCPDANEKILSALVQNPKSRLILSAHDFERKFGNITKLYRHILILYPAAIPKLVYTARHINDCFEAFDLLRTTSDKRIVLCMGQAGLISRIIAKKLGGFVTFASLANQSATAPGQLTLNELKNTYRYDAIKADTNLYGIIGSPVAHSLSPAVHNNCFADLGLNSLYLPLLVDGGKEQFDQFMHNVIARRWLGFAGFSVTIPHKKNALDYVKENGGYVEPLAEKIGAANTLTLDEQSRLGAYNTDYAGALDAIVSTLKIKRSDLKGISTAVIGAGGVARAVVAGLCDAGAKITIYNRTLKKARRLANEFGCDFTGLQKIAGVDAELLINCTSIGMHPEIDKSPVPKDCLKKDIVVFDTVYNPAETLLLKNARDIGAKTISGLDMFISQASQQFKLFTGRDADEKLIRKIVSGRK
jgi:3-dehydroquinate dehydratase/shikimate dehydrogenase